MYVVVKHTQEASSTLATPATTTAGAGDIQQHVQQLDDLMNNLSMARNTIGLQMRSNTSTRNSGGTAAPAARIPLSPSQPSQATLLLDVAHGREISFLYMIHCLFSR